MLLSLARGRPAAVLAVRDRPADGAVAAQGKPPETGPDFAASLRALLVHWNALPGSGKLIALTGGLDTRTLLAAASAGFDAPGDTYTAVPAVRILRTASADIGLAPVSGAGSPYRTISCARAGRARGQLTAAAWSPPTRTGWIHAVWQDFVDKGGALPPGTSVAQGYVYGFGRCYFWSRLGGAAEVGTDELLHRLFPASTPAPAERRAEAFDL